MVLPSRPILLRGKDMKFSLRELVFAYENGCLRKLANLDMALKTSYWVNKLIQRLEPEINQFQKSRNELFAKYGEENDEKLLEIPEEKRSEADAELNELLEQEISVDIDKIALSEDLVGISANDIRLLDPFVLVDFQADD